MASQAAAAAAFLFFALFFAPGAPEARAARVWWLEPDGSGDLPTIQETLYTALAGDTIRLAPGTYYEVLAWPGTQGLVLEGAADAASTIIDAQGQDGVLAVESNVGPSTVVRRLTLTHGDPVGT
jgi:hypothetical protein